MSVAVVGGHEKQIVLAKQSQEPGERGIELPQWFLEPRNVVPVPERLVEIYQVAEK